jgi:hypothetical protein
LRKVNQTCPREESRVEEGLVILVVLALPCQRCTGTCARVTCGRIPMTPSCRTTPGLAFRGSLAHVQIRDSQTGTTTRYDGDYSDARCQIIIVHGWHVEYPMRMISITSILGLSVLGPPVNRASQIVLASSAAQAHAPAHLLAYPSPLHHPSTTARQPYPPSIVNNTTPSLEKGTGLGSLVCSPSRFNPDSDTSALPAPCTLHRCHADRLSGIFCTIDARPVLHTAFSRHSYPI